MVRKESFKSAFLNKQFWVGTFTLTGTVIGAGILGLPFVFSKSGFYIGLFWLIFLGIIILISKLYLGEITLRTKQIHQLPGYAKKYLGKWGRRIMVFEMVFGIYSALLAYLIAEGQSFSQLIFGDLKYALYFAIAFWLVMTLLLREGLRGLKRVEFYGVIALLLLVLGIIIWYAPGVKIENIAPVHFNNFFLPLGVVLFALLGFSAVPEMRRELTGNEKFMKKAIFFGLIISIVVYILFSFIFVANLGTNVPEIASLAFGKIVIIFGIVNLLTSYFVLSFAIKDMFRFDFRYSRKSTFILVSLVPLAIYLLLYFANLLSFASILGIAGVISAGLAGILILLMNRKAKEGGDRKPEYSVPINWFIIILITIIFVAAVVFQLII